MFTVKSTIKSLTAMLMDRLDVDMVINPPPSVRKYTDAVLQAQAEKAIYSNGKGLYLPSRNLRKCLIQGAKAGRITLGGRRNLYPFIEASVFVEPNEILFNKKKPDGFTQFPMRRKDGNVIPKRLPVLTDWELSFTLLIYDDEIMDKVHEALQIAGISVGLGYGRPEYGRFEVTSWEATK
jgi:hypothetical protein